ncbi:MAG TPA: hypothetical protein VGG39_06935 [Polyangiaceae bacterium]|jgi:hypothetical protein
MAHTTPLARVKETHGDKAKLVAAVEKFVNDDLWVARTNKDKGLAHVSNAKLLRLLATFTEVKDKFGTREKLIDAIVEVEKRTKDAGYRQRLTAWPVPRLYDAYKSAAKRTGAKTGAKADAKAAKKAAAKPAGEHAQGHGHAKPAKKAAAKKAAKA